MKKTLMFLTISMVLLGAACSSGDVSLETQTKEESPKSAPPVFKESSIVLAGPTDSDVQNLPSKVSVTLKTTKGDIMIQLLPNNAPLAVANFLNLVKANFYDGITFHRVIPDFMIQTGDPNSKDSDWSDDGMGSAGYQFKDEVSVEDQIVRGTVAMANAGPDTNGSQFFIVTIGETPWLNGKHTIFGTVTSGMEVADKISQVPRNEVDHPLENIVIEDITVE